MRRSLILLVFVSAPSLFAADKPPQTRLAEVQSIEPTGYSAEMTLDPEKTTFSGSIEIRLNIQKPTRTIWLNQEAIEIKAAVLTLNGVKRPAQVVPGGDDFVGLSIDEQVTGEQVTGGQGTGGQVTGDATLSIQYTGQVISKNSSGIFRQQDGGNWYLFSQFEATDARAAFPCFDEPSYKTPWQLTLHIPDKDAAVSNTPVNSEKTDGSMKTIVFKPTKPLPSYLVAFAVGPFEFVDAGVAGTNKVPVRIVVPKGKTAEARYAAEVTAPILTRLEEYFGIPYPYEKADQVAIPNTAGFGAMENAGVVTYEQDVLLADPKVDRIERQRRYATFAAHELSHQWFGDLVTTAWWDDIWLNEAFATWMERKLIAEWKPEWHTRVADVSDKLSAEGDDSLLSARKIRQPILSKDDINNAFDGITYEKGASVIGMFENWMGPQEFRKGVQRYLKQYAFRTATAGDFLDALGSARRAGQGDIGKAFLTFLNQPGAPMVSVQLKCGGPKPILNVTQKRFLPLGSKGNVTEGTVKETWNIPFCIRYGTAKESHKMCSLLSQTAQEITLDQAKACPTWVQADDDAVGYYLVNYQDRLLASLTTGNAARLTAPERVELIGNAEALSDAGILQASDALALVDTAHNDPERYVVQAAMQLAEEPRLTLVPENLIPNFQRFLQKNFGAKAHELGWVPKQGETALENEDTRLLRPRVVLPVATWGADQSLAQEAKALTEKWFADHSAIDPNMLSSVLRAAAFYGDKTLFSRFLNELKNTKDQQTRRALLTAMESFNDPASIAAGMEALLKGDVPFLEGGRLLFSGQRMEATRKMPLQFLMAHWDEVVAKMPTGGGFDYGSVLPQVGATYCDEVSRNQLKDFFAPRVAKFVGAPRALDQMLEKIDLCIAQKAAQQASVAAFLSKY